MRPIQRTLQRDRQVQLSPVHQGGIKAEHCRWNWLTADLNLVERQHSDFRAAPQMKLVSS